MLVCACRPDYILQKTNDRAIKLCLTCGILFIHIAARKAAGNQVIWKPVYIIMKFYLILYLYVRICALIHVSHKASTCICMCNSAIMCHLQCLTYPPCSKWLWQPTSILHLCALIAHIASMTWWQPWSTHLVTLFGWVWPSCFSWDSGCECMFKHAYIANYIMGASELSYVHAQSSGIHTEEGNPANTPENILN